MKDTYTFPAIFRPDNNAIIVMFPDIPNADVEGEDEEEAMEFAHQCLAMELYLQERAKLEIPEPTKPENVELESNDRIVMINIDMKVERAKITEAINFTLSILHGKKFN